MASTMPGNPVELDNLYSYALIKTSTAGTRTVEFSTTSNTKAQKYTVRVEKNNDDNDYAKRRL